jgi:hypothetical protein
LGKNLRVEVVDEIQSIVNLRCKAGTEQLILLAGHCSIAKDDPQVSTKAKTFQGIEPVLRSTSLYSSNNNLNLVKG